MNTTTVISAASVPAIIGLVEVLKSSGMSTRMAPIAAVIFGILAALAALYQARYPWIEAIGAGVGLGLAASGLYSGTKVAWPTSSGPKPPTTTQPPQPTPAAAGLSGGGPAIPHPQRTRIRSTPKVVVTPPRHRRPAAVAATDEPDAGDQAPARANPMNSGSLKDAGS